jgi:hypothetical protein
MNTLFQAKASFIQAYLDRKGFAGQSFHEYGNAWVCYLVVAADLYLVRSGGLEHLSC